MYRKEPQGWLKHLDFTVLNLIALHASYCMAYFIRMGTENPYHSKLYRTIAVLLTLFQLLVTIVCHIYKGVLQRGRFREAIASVKQSLLVVLLAVFVLFMMKMGATYSRKVMALFGMIYLVIGYVVTLLWKEYIRRHRVAKKSIVIVTVKEYLNALLAEMGTEYYNLYRIAGIVLLDATDEEAGQYNTEFAGSHYEKLKKAYSIWVCTDPPDKHKNSISVVSLQKNDKVSSVDRDKEKYDLINVISICLGGPEYANYDNKIIRLLDVLLRSKMTPEEKKKILEEEYEIPMSENIETEVNNMCSYIDTVYNEAMRIGNEQGEKRGEESMAMLGRQLLEENRIDELMKSYDNVEYRNKLMDQYGIK
mgnify:CR=1 FL=1